jgi:hypothetical protein
MKPNDSRLISLDAMTIIGSGDGVRNFKEKKETG